MREYGIDVGSVSLKLAEFIDGKLVKTLYLKHQGRPYNLLLETLDTIANIDTLSLTGSLTKDLADILGASYINEVEATTKGVLDFHPNIKSIIEIGGEDSKLINISNGSIKDFASNTICAAGTGIFLDQQARRLCFDVEELGAVALNSEKAARIAGRCSVFAKSDMIHLQQIGTKPEDLIAGLCLALARNFRSVIAKGKEVLSPVAFVGGVAANQGMVRSFQDVLKITKDQLIIPKHYNCMGAIGCVLKARELETRIDYKGADHLAAWLSRPKLINRLPPLDGHKKWHALTNFLPPQTKTKAFLGVDVGSISTNLVLIDEKANVLSRRYLWTKGRPLEVVLEGLADLEKEIGDKVEVMGVGTTGSGRYLIGEFIGADIIKNEISCQARAAIELDPQVDTIFEIGGQDSKFISLDKKAIIDFEMNKVCAAGTGSFLEEQAQALGIKLVEFGDRALDAKSPINLGERCTVFIGSEVVHHQKDTIERENLLAGLGYSIVFNYLNRVVNGKKIGNRIFFQGGVAANKAVVSAFEEVLKKEVRVPTNYDVTGAIGIALIARDSQIEKTKFRGFRLCQTPYESTSFTCRHCHNECEVNKIAVQDEKVIFYGGRCERYEEKEHKAKSNLPDLFRLRNEIFFKTEEAQGIEIGIPRTLIFYEMFPFFYRFLVALGFKPILSEPTNRKIIEMGTEVSSADTCLPVKIALGHVRSLIDKGIKQLFMPSVITMPPHSQDFDRSFVCPYVQTMPYLTRAIFGEIQIHEPYLYFDRGKKGIEESLIEFGRKFGKNDKEIKTAIDKALSYQREVQEKVHELGKDIVEKIDDFAFVVCSRPYNGYDLGMNLDLPKKIRDLGIQAIPIDLLPVDYGAIREDFSNMYWHYGQRILAAAEMISQNKKLFGVYLSNFSCGPDSFLIRFFKEKLAEKPFLLLELDEHSADAGFITRCEAFHDSIKSTPHACTSKTIKAKSEIKKNRTIYIPNMCDSAQAFASAMRYAGIDAQVLPAPDEESVIIGREHTAGRECLPAIITAGDMVRKIKKADFQPEKSAFFMAQGSGPCRFGQYYKLHRIILDELGYPDIPLYAPSQGPSLFDDLGPMGLRFLILAWDGICATDGLEAKSRRIRPYEKEPGKVDKIYQETLQEICAYLERGRNILPLIRAARHKFDQVPVHDFKKPKIGIVGEIYVRSQDFSNSFLIRKLETLGCEVSLPSIGEWFFYTNFTRVRNCYWFGEYRRSIFTKIFDRYMRWRQNKIFNVLGLTKEADIRTLLNHASHYLHHTFEGEAVVTIGKTIEYMKEKYSGVINVMPFTCMPGNIVTTIFKAVKDKYPEFPLLILSFDGLDHAIDAMRLETFVGQARKYS